MELSAGVRALAVALTLALAVSCSGGTGSSPAGSPGQIQSPQPQPEKTLTVVQLADAETLDPTVKTGVETANANLQIYDGLVRMSDDMKVTPMLATSWKMLDPLSWRLELRRGVKFHNGDSFTAADVKFTIERILNPATKSGMRSYIAPIKEVFVEDDFTVQLKLSAPYATLMRQLARAVMVVPAKAFESAGADAFAANPIGTGPFQFVSWSRDQQIVLKANPTYWAGRPKVDRVVIRAVAEAATRAATVLNGEADIAGDIPLSLIQSAQNSDRASVLSARGLTQGFLAMNAVKGKPYDDLRVRQAVNHALNVEEIIASVLGGRGTRLAGPYAPLSLGFTAALPPYRLDQAKARQLLADAGYPSGLDTELWYQAGGGISGADELVAQAIAGQLATVGVRAKLRGFERNDWVNTLTTGRAPALALADNRDSIGDGDFILGLWYDSTRRAPYYRSKQVDALIAQQLALPDETSRAPKLQEIARFLHDDAAAGFLYSLDLHWVTSKKLVGWAPRSDRLLWLYPASVK